MATTRHQPALEVAPWHQPGSGILVQAHRGGRIAIPNTIRNAQFALLAGAHVIESDWRSSADFFSVCFHDRRVNPSTDGFGEVAGLTLRQLQDLDPGDRLRRETSPWRRYLIENVERCALPPEDRIPTLEEFLDTISAPLVVDVKDITAMSSIERTVRERQRLSTTLFTAFHCLWRNPFDELVPTTPRAAAPREAFAIKTLLNAPSSVVKLLGGSVSTQNHPFKVMQIPIEFHGVRLLSKQLVQWAEERGISIAAYTVNNISTLSYCAEIGVKMVVTDDVPGTVSALDRWGAYWKPAVPTDRANSDLQRSAVTIDTPSVTFVL